MKCRNCGTEVTEKDRFCPNCGLFFNVHFSVDVKRTPIEIVEYKRPEPKRKPEEEERPVAETELQEVPVSESEPQEHSPESIVEESFPEAREEAEQSTEIKPETEEETKTEQETEESAENEAGQDVEKHTEREAERDIEENTEDGPEDETEQEETPAEIRKISDYLTDALEVLETETLESEALESEEEGEAEGEAEGSSAPEAAEEAEGLTDAVPEEKAVGAALENAASEAAASESAEEKPCKEGEIEEFLAEATEEEIDAFERTAALPGKSLSSLKAALIRKRRFWVPAGAAALVVVSGICYWNVPAVRFGRELSQGRGLMESGKEELALPLLEKLHAEQPEEGELYLLLAKAYAATGKHAEAVQLLENAPESVKALPGLSEYLSQLSPLTEISLPSGSYQDPIEITLSNAHGYEIRYSLQGEENGEVIDELYRAPIRLSLNGSYMLKAYTVSVDGEAGKTSEASYQIALDAEKYHLNDWLSTEDGMVYIDGRGARTVGWLTLEDKKYYLDEDGYRAEGLRQIGNDSYFFDEEGVCRSGWQSWEGKRYFFDEEGRMLKNTWIDNTYYVGDDGAMLTDTVTADGYTLDQNGMRSFNAAMEYAAYPDTLVQAHSRQRRDMGEYYEIPAQVYHSKSNGRPVGDAYEVTIRLRKSAVMHYLDEALPNITARDAVSFLPELYMQKIVQNEEGQITEYSIVLGEKRTG